MFINRFINISQDARAGHVGINFKSPKTANGFHMPLVVDRAANPGAMAPFTPVEHVRVCLRIMLTPDKVLGN